jgi:hypothetical protein
LVRWSGNWKDEWIPKMNILPQALSDYRKQVAEEEKNGKEDEDEDRKIFEKIKGKNTNETRPDPTKEEIETILVCSCIQKWLCDFVGSQSE